VTSTVVCHIHNTLQSTDWVRPPTCTFLAERAGRQFGEMAQKKEPERSMEARVGRDNQRYGPDGERLVAGVVPVSNDGKQVLLIQSTRRKAWVLPKGGWEKDEKTQEDAACREAWEEAGIESKIVKNLGVIPELRTPEQLKKHGGEAPKASYTFFEVRVEKEADQWPEKHKRDRKWMSYLEAKKLLKDRPELLEALERSSVDKMC